jgi:hypothetical protein
MLRENYQDASQIIQNIITQPLAIPGASESISLLAAAQDTDSNNLRKILEAFHTYPELTQLLTTELDLLARDLEIK